ncbi:hypothetical protein [Saccharothrix algeriensis]|uniref:Uncharacterized protein YukE n=1 Tax=Saccharothrix algeriensis TaxID=173560 RepID=A0A8T8HS23_9PSEU|nr:hypothetical protein [Saccharothrix algeriensis]MBM7812429.1 uncharacterized protein YukE [Saccharothrix algeriensis]QTR01179.1 hypothetical protein J7S33_16955 [Saccharothrix algeriensis]
MFGVRPEALRAASKEFHDGADATGDGAELISMLRLDADALGRVPAAAEFADALARWAGEQSDDLRRGSAWYRDAGEGLAENADAYQRADDDSTSSFRGLEGGLA